MDRGARLQDASRLHPGLSFIRSQLLRPLIPDRLAAIRRWQNGQGIDITNAFPINPKFAKSGGVEDMLRERGFTASLPYIGPSLEFRRRRYVNIVATTAGGIPEMVRYTVMRQ